MNDRSIPFILVACLLSPLLLSGASSSDLNFWLGTWNVSWKNAEGQTQTGKNKISRVLDGKVIQEQFDGNPGVNLIGQSWSVYVEAEKIWKQTWVDNNGSYLDFSGGMRGSEFILSRKGLIRGKPGMQRMRFYNLQKNSFEWAWEVSFDNGESWKLAWLISYSRAGFPDPDS